MAVTTQVASSDKRVPDQNSGRSHHDCRADDKDVVAVPGIGRRLQSHRLPAVGHDRPLAPANHSERRIGGSPTKALAATRFINDAAMRPSGGYKGRPNALPLGSGNRSGSA